MQHLYIHLHEQGASWAYCAEAGCLPEQVASGELSQLPHRDDDLNVVVFVPGVDVLLAAATVPVKGVQKLAQAVPYALEEQLIDDVESMQVAIGKQDNEGKVTAAVVSEKRLQGWLQQLQEVDIEADVIVPDTLALPRINGDWSALKMPGDIVCVRSGEQTGFACDADNLAVMAASHAADAEVEPHAVQFTNCGGEEDNVAEQFRNTFSVPVNTQVCQGDALATLIAGFTLNEIINLRQGAYARSTRWLKGRQRWLSTAVLLVILVVMQFGLNIYQLQKLKSVQADYKNKIEQVFRQTFPDVKRVSDPQKQMAIKLKSLRGSAASGADGYLELMAKISQVLVKIPAVEIRSMSYKNSKVDLELELADLQVLENLKESMLKVAGIQIDVKSSSQRKGKLLSLIQVRAQ